MNQVYKITNQTNGKCYIGLTTQGTNRRWSEHKHRFNLGERDHKLYQAMRKYGIENFKCKTIHETENADELSGLEIDYIKKFDSFNNGYNMTCGGDVVSDETKEKLSKIFKGRKITWAHKTVATRRKNGTITGGIIWKGEHPQLSEYQVKHPDGTIETIKGLRKFCREHNLSHNLMLATIKGLQHHHKGYVLLARLNDYRYASTPKRVETVDTLQLLQGNDIVSSHR